MEPPLEKGDLVLLLSDRLPGAPFLGPGGSTLIQRGKVSWSPLSRRQLPSEGAFISGLLLISGSQFSDRRDTESLLGG